MVYYKVIIWRGDELSKQILYEAIDDVVAMQKASAATPDGCRSTYESITKETYEQETKTVN